MAIALPGGGTETKGGMSFWLRRTLDAFGYRLLLRLASCQRQRHMHAHKNAAMSMLVALGVPHGGRALRSHVQT